MFILCTEKAHTKQNVYCQSINDNLALRKFSLILFDFIIRYADIA